jgi:hypothetical protein
MLTEMELTLRGESVNTPGKMSSFRLYLPPEPPAPAREVADYSAEERDRLRDAFASIAADCRRHRRIALFGAGGFAGCILLAMLLPKSWFPWFAIPVVLSWLISFGAIVSAPRLMCPGCRHEIDRGFGPYCPECGDRQLEPGGWFRSPRCGTCGKTMRRGKYRHYKIRACTHCGLMLDDRGL